MGRVIESSFNIFNHGRMHHNNRPYLVQAVQKVLNSDATKELLRLREAFGYFGHGKRAKSGKLNPEEIEVVKIDGKAVVLQDAPACVTIDINCDDEGNVTFKQELLDTPSGQVVDAMEKAKAGGWSWAVNGTPSNIREFGGIDYVKRPSYISNEKREALMMESIGEVVEDDNSWIKRCLDSVGLGDAAELILESWNNMPVDDDKRNQVELENLMLESKMAIQEEAHQKEIDKLTRKHEAEVLGYKEREETRKKLMMESLEKLPILMTDDQRNAFINMEGKGDVEKVNLMFESFTEKASALPFDESQSKVFIQRATGKKNKPTVEGEMYDLAGGNSFNFPN